MFLSNWFVPTKKQGKTRVAKNNKTELQNIAKNMKQFTTLNLCWCEFHRSTVYCQTHGTGVVSCPLPVDFPNPMYEGNLQVMGTRQNHTLNSDGLIFKPTHVLCALGPQ